MKNIETQHATKTLGFKILRYEFGMDTKWWINTRFAQNQTEMKKLIKTLALFLTLIATELFGQTEQNLIVNFQKGALKMIQLIETSRI